MFYKQHIELLKVQFALKGDREDIMKRIFIFIFTIFLTLLLSSCGVFKTYEDTNGNDDYSLQEITEEMVIKNKGGVQIAAVSSEVTKDGVTNIKLSVGEFNGVNQIHVFRKGSYTVNVNYEVRGGNTRLVITDGSSIIKDFNVNEDNQVYEFTCEKNYYLKLAGESCEFKLNVEIR